MVGFSGLGYAIGTHGLLKHVDEGGVKFTARIMVWRESFTRLCDLQLSTPLSSQKVQTPGALRYRGGTVVLTHLAKRVLQTETTIKPFKRSVSSLFYQTTVWPVNF